MDFSFLLGLLFGALAVALIGLAIRPDKKPTVGGSAAPHSVVSSAAKSYVVDTHVHVDAAPRASKAPAKAASAKKSSAKKASARKKTSKK